MKVAFRTLGLLSAAFLLTNLTACQTDSPGVTNTMGLYTSTDVNGPTDKVTASAQKACEGLKLTNVIASGTKVDGKVTAKNAQGDDVTIDISQAGDNVSKVTIHGGDEATRKQLIDSINGDRASWL
jgi:hypothetical protein